MQYLQIIPGLILTTLLAIISYALTNIGIISSLHLSSLIIAILLGMLIGNLVNLPDKIQAGLTFSAKTVLRLAIILLGFKLSLAQVAQVGSKGLLVVIMVTFATLLFAMLIGRKLGLNRNLSVLVGTGTAICGASAIAAVAPIVKADEEDTAFAIALITIFGTISIFLFPLIQQLLSLPDLIYAIWAGSSIHEVAQVVAAGFAVGETTGQFATIVKLSRVVLIIPVVIILGFLEVRNGDKKETNLSQIMPWFVLGFLITIIINSLNILPVIMVDYIVTLDGFLLTVAMAGMGLNTNFRNMRKVGRQALNAGFLVTLFISIFGLAASWLII